MWFARFALRRPYTIAALAILVCLFGAFTTQRTPTDIFPEIDIPVVSVVWTYNGMAARKSRTASSPLTSCSWRRWWTTWSGGVPTAITEIFGPMPGWMPGFVTVALLVLWAPGGFRITCYYYRGAYYKAFWADPPNCTVGEPRKKYLGERYFPLIIQNIHRYFLYIALLFLIGLLVLMFGERCGSTENLASAWVRWCCWSISFFSAATRLAAIPCGI